MMRHCRWFGLLLIVTLAVFVAPAHAQDDSERITNYIVTLGVNTDASMVVREAITYDFGPTEHHGIFRDLPLNAPAPWYQLQVKDIAVVDTAGTTYRADITRGQGKLHIRIGDPNQTVTGVHHYIITYHVLGAIRYFADHQELYWNAIGAGWTVPITDAQVTVLPPTAQVIAQRCYVGAGGSQTPCVEVKAEGDAITFTAPILQPAEGMTVAVSWPRDVVAEPSLYVRLVGILKIFWLCPLPLIVALGLLLRWWRLGRDPRGRGTIITQFDAPPGVTPIAAGTVFDERLQGKDLAAEIIYLATQGYLKIVREEAGNFWKRQGSYRLERLSKSPVALSLESQLLAIIFSGAATPTLSTALAAFQNKAATPTADSVVTVAHFPEDRERLARLWPTFERQVYKQLTQEGYFKGNPATTRLMYYIVGGVLFFVGFYSLSYIMLGLPILLTGVVVAFLGSIMPAKTSQGVIVREHLLGLKRYIEVAEKDRLAFHNAPEKTPERFETLLPYAILLGVDRAWVQQFGDLEQPQWYQDSHGFQAAHFAGALSEFQAATLTSMVSNSSGVSGGSSGGGSGGGGGGSW